MIEANFEGQQMSLQYDGVISDSVRFLKIRFNFDEYWNGFEKTAVFSRNNEKYLVALCDGNSLYLGDNTCYVPQEVIKSQNFFISVFGIENNTVITSSNEPISVAESGTGERIPRDPTPTAWAQMLEIEANTNGIANDLLERAESGEFNGEGVPGGGSAGQFLAKSSNDDYDTEWVDIPESYTKEQTDNKYVPKITTVNGKALSGNITLNSSDVGAYSKPEIGIPKTDLSSGVQSSLDKADTALQQHQDISGKQDKTDNSLNTSDKTVTGAINELNSSKGTYSKPASGIPKTDLSSGVQSSLGKADTALQASDITGKQDVFQVTGEWLNTHEARNYNTNSLFQCTQDCIDENPPYSVLYKKGYFYTPNHSGNNWEQTDIQPETDLTNYYTKTQTDTSLNSKLNSSKVKTTLSTTSGDVYDVSYINTMIGNVESLLSALR